MVDVVEVYRHWYQGRSIRQVAESLGLARNTVAKYLAPAIGAGMAPGGPPVSDERWAQLAADWFPGLVDHRLRQLTWGQFDEHAEFIGGQLDVGVQVSVVYQRLRDQCGVEASQASFRRWLAGTMPQRRRLSATARMPQTGPGEVGQVDYGLMGAWAPPGGTRMTINAFVMTLPFSKMHFVWPTPVMDQLAWSQAHIAAFEFFDGVPARIVPDNLKTGVVKANLYEPLVNRSYRELAEHYGTLIDPARVRQPRDKPHVERAVQYVRQSWWAGATFTSLEHMRAAAVGWCRDVAAQRVSAALDGRTPADVFARIEKPALIRLPPGPFEPSVWHVAKVGPDCHAQVDRRLYSLPYRLIGQRVDVRLTPTIAEFYHDGTLVKTHPIPAARRRQTDPDDYPPQHAAYLSRDAAWCRREAAKIGPATLHVVETLMQPYALSNLRQCQGILRLADKHGPAAVETAALIATQAGDPRYKTIKGIIDAGLPEPAPRPQSNPRAGAILRGPDAFTTRKDTALP